MTVDISQMAMFEGPAPVFPRARTTDSRSSHEAAAMVERTGSAKAQAARVLAAVRKFPNSTSAELSRSARIERYAVARRLPELAAAHLVEKVEPEKHTAPCVISGKRVCRWRPA